MPHTVPFDYHEPAALDEAIEILAGLDGKGRPLAGGTDVLVDLRSGRDRPEALVNLKRIEGLQGVEASEGGLRVGALTTVDELGGREDLRTVAPALADACSVLASPHVRRLATLGGNIARASPAADTAPPLLVLGATATIEGPGGCRRADLGEVYVGPGVTSLVPGDLVTSVLIPAPPPASGSAHLKLGTRGGGTDIAIVGVSAAVTLGAGGVVDEVRIALASVAPTPVRARAAEAALRGAEASGGALEAAAAAVTADLAPISDVRGTADYRRRIAVVLVRRALNLAVERAREAV